MSNAILIAIRPGWCEKIFSGKKTIELRKTIPKKGPPFKCFIYCTKPKYEHEDFFVVDAGSENAHGFYGGGKVVAEFLCDGIERYARYGYMGETPRYMKSSVDGFQGKEINFHKLQLSPRTLSDYGKGRPLFGLHISDLKIYDKPKRLDSFHWYNMECIAHGADGVPVCKKGKPCSACSVTRAPQSWCYVEESTIPGG